MTRSALAAPLAALQLLLVLATLPWYGRYGLHIDWASAWPIACGHGAVLCAWLYSRRYAAHPRKFIFADVLLAFALLLLLTNILSPAQYLAVALKRPLVDSWLAGGDAALGINVATLAHWTAAHPAVDLVLWACYASLVPQFMLPLLVVGLRFRDRERLWEYLFHFHVCLVVTVGCLALWPAACPPAYLAFTPTIDQSHILQQIGALRAGTFHTIDFASLEGLISMPSFHAAGAFIVTWAFRRERRWWMPLAALNVGLVAATFLSGVHYFVDIVGSAALFALSVAAYRLVPTTAKESGLRNQESGLGQDAGVIPVYRGGGTQAASV